MIGVLALQGAFAAHATMLTRCGASSIEVRTPADLESVEALVLPGGESTTMSMMLERSGLLEPLSQRVADGMAVFGTCAGAILLGSEILDGRADQRCLSALDMSVQRNGYGRQIDSFESDIQVQGVNGTIRAVFIRAPRITRVGHGVDVLAVVDDDAVLVRRGSVMASTFHPELGDDSRLHEMFLSSL